MKKIFTFLLSISSLVATAQYVGVNTTSPKANLHLIGAPATTTIADGVLTPRLTRAQLIAKTAYGTDQIGALVYVSDLSGTPNAATTNVIVAGHYYFDGTRWNAWLPVIPQLYGFQASKTTANVTANNATTVISPWNIEQVDSHDWFNAANGRFTPKIAGYYKVNFNAGLQYNSDGSPKLKYAALFKNNTLIFYGSTILTNVIISTGTCTVYMNGTTDFIDVRHFATGGEDSYGVSDTPAKTNFQAFFIGE